MSRLFTPGQSGRLVRGRRCAFTLIELLVVIAIIGVLAALGIGAGSATLQKMRAVKCAASLRTLGNAVLLYAGDHRGEFPRSTHSAASYRADTWTYEIAPYLGIPAPLSKDAWPANFERYYRCPEDTHRGIARWSYALNVFFELTADGDDYAGSPATWRRLTAVPHPGRTVLLAEPKSVEFADHVMCHLWQSAAAAENALDHQRHRGVANYLFLDAHVEALPVAAVFDPGKTDLFNPSTAE